MPAIIRSVVACTFIAGSCITPAAVAAQSGSRLESGTRVRVTYHRGPLAQQVAHVVSSGTDGVVVTFPSPLTDFSTPSSVIALSDGRHLVNLSDVEISRGKESNGLQGLGYGALAGGVTGTLVGIIAGDDSCGRQNCFPRETAAAFVGGIGLVAGAVLGGFIGFFTYTERWGPSSTPSRARLTLEAQPGKHGGTAVSLGVSF